MQLPDHAEVLRIYLGESDRHGHVPTYEAIVLEARRRGLAGATVMRGVMGFGAHSHLHTAKILRLSEDLPIIVDIVDTPERLAAFLPFLAEVITDGLVTQQPVQVRLHRTGQAR